MNIKGLLKALLGVFFALLIVISGAFLYQELKHSKDDQSWEFSLKPKNNSSKANTARIFCNGDLLYHDIVYWSAEQGDGTYDFNNNFRYVKDWLGQGDLVIGDYEGTITPGRELTGYSMFNAPVEVASAIKNAGYDVMALANNHILDMGLEGVASTQKAFNDLGIDTIGVYTKAPRSTDQLLIKEVNGIKIAILNYAYGYNGMEQNLSQKEYEASMSDLDEEKMKEEINFAEENADITIVMPHMGIEYQLQPNEEQKALYHKMIDWGADLIFGGHPHVIQPSEVVNHNGENKFIIYSMGNFLSNQRIETVDNPWTERGVLMDVSLTKQGDTTKIETIQAHPTWVNRTPNGKRGHGFDLYDYTVYVLEDWVQGGKYYGQLDHATQARVDRAYQETLDHVNLQWPKE